ncbi:hypothetical protein [Pukyongiella litopenaei]|uniref:Uncharacterized protein n=1 Tax=Pukyongiella litopenaei TaxID=2605946 RepID=A0A2S0MTC2_9RHOB|nr:hypothetical protein [Pukyongiella litopenaei]AVO39122.2 hypothetical protein C6Y53_16315 [Pukyongiella litopenaei]
MPHHADNRNGGSPPAGPGHRVRSACRAMLRVLAVPVLLATPAGAEFYSAADMARVADRAIPSLRAALQDGIIAHMPRDQRPLADGISLAFPERGPHPMAFFSDPATGTIYMPLESIRFFDDIATLTAWFHGRGCSQDHVHSYLWSLLRKGRAMPSPLRAFALDRDALLADPYTNSLSDRFYSSGLLFILAHETGHLVLRHRAGLTAAASQAQEIAADDFATRHFTSVGTMPMGVLIYYLAAWWRDPEGRAAATGTHPVSAARIRALARHMLDDPAAFSHAEADAGPVAQQRVRDVAGLLNGIADSIAEDGMLSLMPRSLDRDYPASRFPSACPAD